MVGGPSSRMMKGATLGYTSHSRKSGDGSGKTSTKLMKETGSRVADGEEAADVTSTREKVVQEARKRGTPKDVESVAIELLAREQHEACWLRQEKASLLAQLERARREAGHLQSQLSGSMQESQSKKLLDSRLLSRRLSLRDTDEAKSVVDLIRAIHSYGAESAAGGLPPAEGSTVALDQVQAREGRRNLNQALRCLVMDNFCHVNTCIAEVVKFTDRQYQRESALLDQDAGLEPLNMQMVFVEGESLIFRVLGMRLQPRDVYSLCSLEEDLPDAGWGLKTLLAVSDIPVIISTPFQLRLDSAERGPRGVLCPEWVASLDAETPQGEAIIPPSYRARIKDNCTFIYAPLRESAKELLRSADMEPFEGLALAFLERARKLDMMLVSYEGPAEVKVVRSIQHEVELRPACVPEEGKATGATRLAALKSSVRLVAHRVADCVVRCSKSTRIPDRNHQEDGQSGTSLYRLHEFQIALESSEGRGTPARTQIALAFPLGADGFPITEDIRRRKHHGNAHTEFIYCQMPVPCAGKLPFALQADFDITSDTLGLHPTSSWNRWLLSCSVHLFVIAAIADPTLCEAVDRYTPRSEEMPKGGLWSGLWELLDRLLQSHVRVRTESGLMVSRAQAVLRPPSLSSAFISDALLQEVTGGRKHFMDAATLDASTVEGDAQGEGRVCDLDIVLECVARLVAKSQWGKDASILQQLWLFVAEQMAEDKKDVTPTSRKLLRTLPLYPVRGRGSLRAFEGETPLFFGLDRKVRVALDICGPHFRAEVAPELDFDCLRGSRGAEYTDLLKHAIQAMGVKEAKIEDLRSVLRTLLTQKQVLHPPSAPNEISNQGPISMVNSDMFWALRSLVVEGMGYASLQEFVGEKLLSVPVLRLQSDGALGRRTTDINVADASIGRFVIPCFLGVNLTRTPEDGVALLKTGASWPQDLDNHHVGDLLSAPTSATKSWGMMLQWEDCVRRELKVDGGTNRRWQGFFQNIISPQTLVDEAMKGLVSPTTTLADRQAFSGLLQLYKERYPLVFQEVRAAHRVSSARFLEILQDPLFSQNARKFLKLSQGILDACLELVVDAKYDVSTHFRKELMALLPMPETEECPEICQLQDLVYYNKVDFDSPHTVALVMHVLTRQLVQHGHLVDFEPQDFPSSATRETLKVSPSGQALKITKKGSEKWAFLLKALFWKALENMTRSYHQVGSSGDTKQSGRNVVSKEGELVLLEDYCRHYGVWAASLGALCSGAPACYPLRYAVWTLEDPISSLVVESAHAKNVSVTVIALDKEIGDSLGPDQDGSSDVVHRLFVDTLDVSEGRLRERYLLMLQEALERWSHAAGPMPRDVEALYRALAGAAGLAHSSSASQVDPDGTPETRIRTKNAAACFEFSTIPVLDMNFKVTSLTVLSAGAAAVAAASEDFLSGRVLHMRPNGGGTSNLCVLGNGNIAKAGPQPLVGVAASGDSDDSALDWFYRDFFPSRCLHPAIFSLLKQLDPVLLPRLAIAKPRPSFLESYGDTTSTMVSVLRAMKLDVVNAARLLCEVYAGSSLPHTELARYWANAIELRDLVLAELWKAEGQDRNEELIETVRTSLRLPLCAKTQTPGHGAGGSRDRRAPVPMANALQRAEKQDPIYLGSLLGIDLEVSDKHHEQISGMVKHPGTTRDSSWHRASRAEDGFTKVEESCYWERFLLALGVVPLTEAQLPLIPTQVLNKVFLALAKFNGLLNSTEPTVASKYNIWHTYHVLYRTVDGNMYLTRYKGLRSATAPGTENCGGQSFHHTALTGSGTVTTSGHKQQQHPQQVNEEPQSQSQSQSQQQQQQQQTTATSQAATNGTFSYYGTSALPSVSPYLPTSSYPFSVASSSYGTGTAPRPPPVELHTGFAPPPVKRQRSPACSSPVAFAGLENNTEESTMKARANPTQQQNTDCEHKAKTPRLVSPVPPLAPSPVQQEEGEVEEGEIED